MTTSEQARASALEILSEFSGRAAISTASAELCGFILASAELVATEPVVAEMVGAIMAPEQTEAEWEAKREARRSARIVIQNMVSKHESRPPTPYEIWTNVDPDAGL